MRDSDSTNKTEKQSRMIPDFRLPCTQAFSYVCSHIHANMHTHMYTTHISDGIKNILKLVLYFPTVSLEVLSGDAALQLSGQKEFQSSSG